MQTVEVGRVSSSPRTIVELNISHFRDLMKTETDPVKRQILADLLAEHEVQLLKLLRQPGKAAND